MNKKYNFYRLFIIFLLTCFSLHVFIIDLKIPNINYSEVTNSIYRFYLYLWLSINEFDVIWILLFMLIYNYFFHNYFIDYKWNNIKLISCIIAVIISFSIIIGISISSYGDLSMIFNSFVQLFKCVMVGIGYYLLIYVFVRNIMRLLFRGK